MGRAPCCDKANVKKGPWSPEEDAKLKEYMEKYGTGGNWIALPQKAGLKRCGKSCRLRWLNYLRPNLRHGEFSDDEDRIICSLFTRIGSRWSIIAGQLPGRTDNDIKNYWNTKLKKKLQGNMPQKRPLQPTISQSPFPNLNSQIPSLYDQSLIRAFSPTTGTPTSLIPSPPMHGISFNQLFCGGEPSCTSSSDGSGSTSKNIGENLGFHQSYFSCGGVDDHDSNRFFITSTDASTSTANNNGYEHKGQNGNCFGHQNPLDYSMEDIKQLITSNHIATNLNFFVDDIKTEEGTLFY